MRHEVLDLGTWEMRFGSVRSQMGGELAPTRFIDTLHEAWELDHARYADEMLPYVLESIGAGATRAWTLRSLETLERAARVLPDELFRFSPAKLDARTLDAIARHGSMSQVVALEVRNRYPAVMDEVTRSTHFERLEELDLRNSQTTDAHLDALAKSHDFGSLRRLNLGNNWGVRDEGVLALARAVNLKNLEWVDLSRCYVRPRALEALKTSRALPKLRRVRT